MIGEGRRITTIVFYANLLGIYCVFNGASKLDRTVDLLITNQLLYQLSYAGVGRGEEGVGTSASPGIGLRFLGWRGVVRDFGWYAQPAREPQVIG